ncbi:MAG: Flp family type IVb pilin [Candidatus Binataceae bacterium]|nr:Flp family type IVb pilin [Candidatus Binataceae bacterium]
MELITNWYVRAREAHKGFNKGQTMTEYALILSAVAVVVFAGYQLMGTDIKSLLGTVDGQL